MRKLGLTLFAGLMVLLLLKGFTSVLSSNFSMQGIVVLVVCMMPAFLIFCIAIQEWWLGILIGATIWQYPMPFAPLSSVEIGIFMAALVGMLVTMHTIQSGKLWLVALDSWQSKLMLVIAAIIFVRIAIERPGSVHSGQIGGAKEAYTFLLGAVAFFFPKFLFDENPRPAVTRRVALTLAIMALLLHLGTVFYKGMAYGFLNLFVRSAWFLSAYMLACVAESSWRMGFGNIRSTLSVMVVFILGALSAHRSRVLFAAGIIFSVSYVYKHLSRNLALMVIAGSLAIIGLMATGKDLPRPVARSLSIIMPSKAATAEDYIHRYGLSDEIGWESPFRGVLMDMAWDNLSRHPLWGKGYGFSIDEYWVSYFERNTMKAEYRILAATGAYHNSLIELAVANGIPVVILFCIAYVGILWPFLKQLRMAENADVRIVLSAMLGLFVSETGQVLMNGGSQDYYIISMLLGVMHYATPYLTMKADEERPGESSDEIEEVAA